MIDINNTTTNRLDLVLMKKNFLKVLRFLGLSGKYISIAIVGSSEMKKINNKYRGKNKDTDVLSFPYIFTDRVWDFKAFDDDNLGEIIFSYDKIKSQAIENKKTIAEEFYFMFAHSVLHLIGFEDESTDDKYLDMKRWQDFLCKKLKIKC